MSHTDLWPRLLSKLRTWGSCPLLWLPQGPYRLGRFQALLLEGLLRDVGLRSRGDRVDGIELRTHFIGNPRVDRISQRVRSARSNPAHVLEDFDANPDPRRLNLLVGSAWPDDVRVLRLALERLSDHEAKRINVVLIPHETNDPHLLGRMKSLLPSARLIAVEGLLVEAYRDFDVAFVGGGYRTGLHSVLEPALWGLPTICGPHLRKQATAPKLVDAGSLRVARDAADLADSLRELLDSPGGWIAAAERARASLVAEQGAAERLARLVRELCSPGLETHLKP